LAGVFVVGVSGWMLLRHRNVEHCFRSLKVGAWVGFIGIVLTTISGDTSAVTVAERQPMKLAAMEGVYRGQNGQEIVAFGILNPAKTVTNDEDPFLMKIGIPYGLSLLANHDAQSFVPGINDIIDGISKDRDGKELNTVSYAERMERGKLAKEAIGAYNVALKKDDKPAMAEASKAIEENFRYFGYGYLDTPEEAVPNVALTFYTFHVMVMVGGFLIIFLLAALVLAYKRQLLEKARWARLWHWLAIITIPLTYICSACGWIVAEVGRQPWTIQDLMPNKVAISDLSASYVQVTFWVFAVIFTALLIADVSIIMKQIAQKSKQDLDTVK
ncbi:MAG: cytochrome ubiquinol oxidase subunit I, partial [Bacteroidales bacterium]|nr:cytochrome ubiquinol oxidase subunit I [Bacteroidales bacterium]